MTTAQKDIAHCARCETPIERGDLRCSICGQAVPVDSSPRTVMVTRILRCTGCGAAMAYDPDRQAPACSFCESVLELEDLADPMEQSEGFLPFTIKPTEARQALRAWLGKLGWFRPNDLGSAARLESLKPLWWVGWVFDAQALVSWAADSNAGSRRSAWAPHAGQVEMEFDDILVSASRGLTEDEVTHVGAGCDLATSREEPEGAGAEAVLEQFDLQRSQARQRVVHAVQALATARVASSHVPGTRHRKVHVAVVLRRLVTRRLSFPAYVLAYRYGDRLYRAVVSGQDSSIITGSAPYSAVKIAIAIGAGALIVLVALAIVLSNL